MTSFKQSAEEKECYRCNTVRPITEFPKSAIHTSGIDNMCNHCNRARTRDYYERNKEMIREKSEAYRKANWDKLKSKIYEYRKKNPEKQKARQAVNNAIAGGKFTKKTCKVCGDTKVQFHHSKGYEKENWFIGVWLCPKHHAEHHKQLRELARSTPHV